MNFGDVYKKILESINTNYMASLSSTGIPPEYTLFINNIFNNSNGITSKSNIDEIKDLLNKSYEDNYANVNQYNEAEAVFKFYIEELKKNTDGESKELLNFFLFLKNLNEFIKYDDEHNKKMVKDKINGYASTNVETHINNIKNFINFCTKSLYYNNFPKESKIKFIKYWYDKYIVNITDRSTFNGVKDYFDKIISEHFFNEIMKEYVEKKSGCIGTHQKLQTTTFRKKDCSSGNEIDAIVKKLCESQKGGYFGVGGTTPKDLAGMLITGGANFVDPVPMNDKNYTNTLVDALNKLIDQVQLKGMVIDTNDKTTLKSLVDNFGKMETEIVNTIKKLNTLYEKSKHLGKDVLKKDPDGTNPTTNFNLNQLSNITETEMKDLTEKLSKYKKTEGKLILTYDKLLQCLKTVSNP